MTTYPTCHRDPKAVNTHSRECSHVDCPNRRRIPELDHASHQQARGGFCDVPSNPATGCYRVQPTCKE